MDVAEEMPSAVAEDAKSRQLITKAYTQARYESLIYSLSELAFGSLLASYFLGFVGFVLSATSIIDPLLCDKFLDGFTYVFVSTTYAYLTASMYISYHSIILARPSLSLPNMRWDFAVSLGQAVSFGLSMLFPDWFPVFAAFVLLLGLYRQKREYDGFRVHLERHVPEERVSEITRDGNTLDSDIRTLLISHGFDFWLPPKKWQYLIALLPILLSSFSIYLKSKYGTETLWAGKAIFSFSITCVASHLITCIAAAAIFLPVVYRSNVVIKQASDRISSKSFKTFDKEYDSLLQELSK